MNSLPNSPVAPPNSPVAPPNSPVAPPNSPVGVENFKNNGVQRSLFDSFGSGIVRNRIERPAVMLPASNRKKKRRKTSRGGRRKKRTRRRRGRGLTQSKPRKTAGETELERLDARPGEIWEDAELKMACMKKFVHSAPMNDVVKVERLAATNLNSAYDVMIEWCKKNPTNPMNIGGRRRKRRTKRRTGKNKKRRRH